MGMLSSKRWPLVLFSFITLNSIVVYVFVVSRIRPAPVPITSISRNSISQEGSTEEGHLPRITFTGKILQEHRDNLTTSAIISQPVYALNQSRWRCNNQTEVEERNLVCRRRLPAVIGIGAKKSGTGALIFFLDSHPSMRIRKGEPHQWDWHPKRNIAQYRREMPVSSQYQLTMEKSPAYFVGNDIPAAIARDVSPNVKLILILRDPVKRAISDYVHVRELQSTGMVRKSRPRSRKGQNGVKNIQYKKIPKYPHANINYIIKETFEQSVLTTDGRVNPENAILFTGLYALHLRNWLKTFPLEQILLLDGELFTKNPLPQLQDIESFLGLPKYFDADKLHFNSTKGFFCLSQPFYKCAGVGKGRSHPDVDSDTLQKLYEFYEPHNRELEILTRRTFSWTKH